MGESFPRVKFWLLPIFFVWGGGGGGKEIDFSLFRGKKGGVECMLVRERVDKICSVGTMRYSIVVEARV